MFKWLYMKQRVYPEGYWATASGTHGAGHYHDKYGELMFGRRAKRKGEYDLCVRSFPDLPDRPKEELIRRIVVALQDEGFHKIEVVDDA